MKQNDNMLFVFNIEYIYCFTHCFNPCFIHSFRSIRTRYRNSFNIISLFKYHIQTAGQIQSCVNGKRYEIENPNPLFHEAFAFIYDDEVLRIKTLFESFHGETHSGFTHARTYYRSLNFLKCIEWIQRTYFNRLTFLT